MTATIPIVLFAYARPNHLTQTLECLRKDNVPLIYAFADGPRSADKQPLVAEVRQILRSVDWCEVVLREREQNWGLGQSILAGVTEILNRHEAAIIFEDDLICVPGTYAYLCAALNHYRDDSRVMSMTAWTHPKVIPDDIGDQPYFDGRAECWVWGTWKRAWQGMEKDALTLMRKCARQGIDVYRYGADLPSMAKAEKRQNIWAVRWLYWHILNGGLCLRPPWSMVEHIGFDAQATNFQTSEGWANPPLRSAPPVPKQWPEPVEHAQMSALWQKVCGSRPSVFDRFFYFARRLKSKVLRMVSLK